MTLMETILAVSPEAQCCLRFWNWLPEIESQCTGEMDRSFAIIGQTHCSAWSTDGLRAHTLAQKYLIELLLWSASGVHKQSPKVWQENWMTWRENHCIRILSLSLQKATVPSDEVSSKSDCENRTVDWNLLTPKFWRRFRCSIIHNGNWKNQTTCRYLA